MQCPACQHENPTAVKFCGECGARLERGALPAGTAANPARLWDKLAAEGPALGKHGPANPADAMARHARRHAATPPPPVTVFTTK